MQGIEEAEKWYRTVVDPALEQHFPEFLCGLAMTMKRVTGLDLKDFTENLPQILFRKQKLPEANWDRLNTEW